MPRTQTTGGAIPIRALAVLGLLLCVAGTACKKRTVQAAPPVVVTPPAPAPETTPAPAEKKPEPAPEMSPTPAPAKPAPRNPAPRSSAPAKPVPPPEPEPAPARPAPPQISPRMSPAQQAEFEQKTNQAIATSERNLQRAYGRKLTAAQLDLVEKIRGFLGQSREAARAADWVRARNLAEKAQVLSAELVNSL